MEAWVGQEVFPPIFNIADVAITCGVAWIILRQKSWLGSGAMWAQPASAEAASSNVESAQTPPDDPVAAG